MRYNTTQKSDLPIKLDAKDKKILAVLAENARISYTQLAKQTRLSRDTVSYRVQQYEEKGIIQGYRTVVDIQPLGFMVYHLFLQVVFPQEDRETKFRESVKNASFTRAIIKCTGKYDYEIAFVAKSISHLEKAMDFFLEDIATYVQSYELLTLTKTLCSYALPRTIVTTKTTTLLEKNQDPELDHKDIALLTSIADEGKKQLHALALQLHCSSDAVLYRLKQLKASGIILKFVPAFNYQALQHQVYTLLLHIMPLNKQQQNVLQHFFDHEKGTLWIAKTLGKYNVIVYYCIQDQQEIHTLIAKLRQQFKGQFLSYEVLIASEELKYTYLPKGLLV